MAEAQGANRRMTESAIVDKGLVSGLNAGRCSAS